MVFDIEKSDQKKEENKNTEEFIKAVTSVDFSENLTGNLENDFRLYAERQKIDNVIADIVINTMNIVKTGGHIDES